MLISSLALKISILEKTSKLFFLKHDPDIILLQFINTLTIPMHSNQRKIAPC
jgi:hypothetical protein